MKIGVIVMGMNHKRNFRNFQTQLDWVSSIPQSIAHFYYKFGKWAPRLLCNYEIQTNNNICNQLGPTFMDYISLRVSIALMLNY